MERSHHSTKIAAILGACLGVLAGGQRPALAEGSVETTVGPTLALVFSGEGTPEIGGEVSVWWARTNGPLIGADVAVSSRRAYVELQVALPTGDRGPGVGLSSGVFGAWSGGIGAQLTFWAFWAPIPLFPFLRVDYYPKPWADWTAGLMLKVSTPILALMLGGRS